MKNALYVQKTTTIATNTFATIATKNLRHYKQTNKHRGGIEPDTTPHRGVL